MLFRTFVSLTLLALLVTSNAAGLTLNAQPEAIPATMSPGDALIADAQALTDALAAAAPHEALALVAQEAGHDYAPLALPADPLAYMRTTGLDPDALPADIRLPIARLWAATHIADTLAQEAVAGLDDTEIAILLQAAQETDAVPADHPDRMTVSGVPTRATAEADALAAMYERVDMDKMLAAADLVLRTIDDTTPQFPVAPLAGDVGCLGGTMVYDNPPYLGVADVAPNLHTTDYILLVDLGGNDCYRSKSGGGQLGASVVVDLSGDDDHLRTSTTENVVAQGAAVLGVGILADLLGNDRYVASTSRAAPEPGPAAPGATTTAQGAAGAGVGVLVDGAGFDTFEADSWSSGGIVTTNAQGGGALGGVGLLVNGDEPLDEGGSTYDADAYSALHLVSDEDNFQTWTRGTAFLQGQGGASLGGAGALVDAVGDDAYAANSEGYEATQSSQGGAQGGVGILVDGAGSDTYHSNAIGDITLTYHINDLEFCWSVWVNVVSSATTLAAHGGGILGAGLMADAVALERDLLSAQAISRATADAQVVQSASPFCTNNAEADANTGNAVVVAQGAGQTGAGILLGSTGTTVYDAHAESEAMAIALVHHGRVGVTDADANSGDALVRAHAAAQTGAGIVVDPAGNDDYLTSAATTATEISTTGGTVGGGVGVHDLRQEGWAQVGVGWLIDLGGFDDYSTPVAANDSCWTGAGSPTGNGNYGRGRDLSPPYYPLPPSCP